MIRAMRRRYWRKAKENALEVALIHFIDGHNDLALLCLKDAAKFYKFQQEA